MKTKAIVFAALIGLGLSPALSAANVVDETRVVSLDKGALAGSAVDIGALDILTEWAGKLYVVAGPRDIELFDRARIDYVPETLRGPAIGAIRGSQNGGNGDYHSYAELETDLFALERKHPLLAKVFDIGDTLEKRDIYALKISDNVSFEEEEAEVLFLGCHHAREWISVEVPYLLGKYLLENYQTDADVKRLVDSSEIWIVPLVNPDGLEYSIHVYRYWRKNRRDNGQGVFRRGPQPELRLQVGPRQHRIELRPRRRGFTAASPPFPSPKRRPSGTFSCGRISGP